jgi:hypothetical protein
MEHEGTLGKGKQNCSAIKNPLKAGSIHSGFILKKEN